MDLIVSLKLLKDVKISQTKPMSNMTLTLKFHLIKYVQEEWKDTWSTK